MKAQTHCSEGILTIIKSIQSTLKGLAIEAYEAKASQAIDCFEKQIPEMTQGIHAWWRWTIQALSQETDSVEIQNWLLTVLLPWVYWLQKVDKTQQAQFKARYQQAAEAAAQRLLSDECGQSACKFQCTGNLCCQNEIVSYQVVMNAHNKA